MPAGLIAVITQTESIVWSLLGFAYLCLLLTFARTLLRGPKPINWRRYAVGVFVEKRGEEDDDDDDDERGS